MKNKCIPALVLLLFVTLSASAQMDTVVTTFHLQGTGWVKQIGDAKGDLKMKMETEFSVPVLVFLTVYMDGE